MRRYTWIVLTRCTPGLERDYERWYDEEHIPDLLRVPGIVAARRGGIAGVQSTMIDGALALTPSLDGAYAYMALYSIEADDPQAVLAEVIARANTPAMMLSEHMTDAHTILYEDA